MEAVGPGVLEGQAEAGVQLDQSSELLYNCMNNKVVYFHRNPQTKEVFYVGIGNTNRPSERWQRRRVWKEYVKEFGDPIIEIVHTGLTWEEAVEKEIYYIALFGRRDIRITGTLLNMTDGGDGIQGLVKTDEHKAKISKANLGKKRSPEICKRLSEQRQGRKHKPPTEETRRKIAVA